MHPILFEFAGITIYSYGFFIALGVVAGASYLVIQGKKEVGLTFDQANSLFLLLFLAAVVGGKLFLFFEEPSFYFREPGRLLTGRGFVFYGSFIFCVPTMLWFFNRHKLPTFTMLDIMAITTCLVHMFGRVGCFMAGCCYGLPTSSAWGVVFSDPACYAEPKGEHLHPVQLYEAGYIFIVMVILLVVRGRKKFKGQLFFGYLMLYAVGRYVLEFLRGDVKRGFVIDPYLSHSQLIAFVMFSFALYFYWRGARKNKITG